MTDHVAKGFLLTRGSADRFNSTEIRLWASTDRGPVLLRLRHQKPVFFINSDTAAQAMQLLKGVSSQIEIKPLNLETFSGIPAAGVYCDTIQLGYRASDVLRDAGLDVFEADIRLHERFLMERFIRGAISFTGTAEARPGYLEYIDPRIKAAEYLPSLKSLSLDIECDMDNTLFSVGIAGCGVEEVIMIGQHQAFDEFSICWVADERALLKHLISRIDTGHGRRRVRLEGADLG